MCLTSSSVVAVGPSPVTGCHGRSNGVPGTVMTANRPACTCCATACSDTKVTPRPATAVATTAPWDPRMSCAGSASSAESSVWQVARVR